MDDSKDAEQVNEKNEFTMFFYSRSQFGSLLPWLSKSLLDLGIHNSPGSSYIQGNKFNIRFFETNYGCEFHLFFWGTNKESFLSSDFSRMLQYMVNKDKVWSNEYTKRNPSVESIEILRTAVTKFWKPWEHIPGASELDINIIYLWCATDVPQIELERYLSISVGSFSVKLNQLRNEYNVEPYLANIPNGKQERNKYYSQWLIYLSQAPIEEKENHENKKIKLLAERLNRMV